MRSIVKPHGYECVKITDGYVILDDENLRGLGLGTLVFSEGVAWARANFPDYDVAPISLDRPDHAKFEQLTRFYGRFGLSWDQPPPGWEWGEKSLISRPIKAREMRTHPLENLPRIRQLDVPKLIAHSVEAAESVREVHAQLTLLRNDRITARRRLTAIGNRINFAGWLLILGLGVFIGRLWGEGADFLKVFWR